MNEWHIELRLNGWVGGRVTRVEGRDPCAWGEMDWLANLINRSIDLFIGYWVVYFTEYCFFRIWKSSTKHSPWTRHDNHILSYCYTFDHVSTVHGGANGVWHSFYFYQNRSLSIKQRTPQRIKKVKFLSSLCR